MSHEVHARRPYVGRGGKIPRHGLHALLHLLDHAVEQEGSGIAPRAVQPPAQQRAVEQHGCSIPFSIEVGTPYTQSLAIRCLSVAPRGVSLSAMDAEASPSRSISGHLRGVLDAPSASLGGGVAAALDIALLPTLCVSCREPVDGEGVCAGAGQKLCVHCAAVLSAARRSGKYDPGPELLSMEAIANPPAYQRARATAAL